MSGNVLLIQIARAAGVPMEELAEAIAIKGEGLAGDRYQQGAGTFSKVRVGQTKRHISLIAVEGLEAANGELERPFTFGDTRRNLLTRGVSLNTLVDREFMIGNVLVRGVELCTPCNRPSQLSGKTGFREAFQVHGGLRVEILTGGVIRPGDQIVVTAQ